MAVRGRDGTGLVLGRVGGCGCLCPSVGDGERQPASTLADLRPRAMTGDGLSGVRSLWSYLEPLVEDRLHPLVGHRRTPCRSRATAAGVPPPRGLPAWPSAPPAIVRRPSSEADAEHLATFSGVIPTEDGARGPPDGPWTTAGSLAPTGRGQPRRRRHRRPATPACGHYVVATRPVGLPPGLGVADSEEQAVGPALVLGRIPQATNIAPDVEQRLLGGVLGQMLVTKDAVGQSVQTGLVGHDQCLEGTLVAVLDPNHELLVHATASAG